MMPIISVTVSSFVFEMEQYFLCVSEYINDRYPLFSALLFIEDFTVFSFLYCVNLLSIFSHFRPVNEQVSNFCSGWDHAKCLVHVKWYGGDIPFSTIFWQIFNFCIPDTKKWFCIYATSAFWNWEWEWLLLWLGACGKGILWAMLLWIS